MPEPLTIGVLAMQGAFRRHAEMISALGHSPLEVRTVHDISEISGLIIPGGESTTIGKLLTKNSMVAPLISRIRGGMPVFGTCAGMILLAETITGMDQPHLAVMNIEVERNAYGRQKESFEASFPVKNIGSAPFTGVFIRAPKITGISENIEVLAEFETVPVLVKQGNILAASFHPELTGDMRIHSYFISMFQLRSFF